MQKTILGTELLLSVTIISYFYHIHSGFFQVVWAISVTAMLLFIPGYRWSYVFFSKSELTLMERVLISIAISFALMASLLMYAMYMDMAPTPLRILLLGVVSVIVAGLYTFLAGKTSSFER